MAKEAFVSVLGCWRHSVFLM